MKKKFAIFYIVLSCMMPMAVYAAEDTAPSEESKMEESEMPTVTHFDMETDEEEVMDKADDGNPYVYYGDYDEADDGMGSDYTDGIDPDGNAHPKKGFAFVTFVASVQEGISADKVTMECYHMDTYKDYSFNLYHINDYTTHAELPYGRYYIYTGGFYGDAAGEYPIEKKVFEVKDGSNVVTFKVGDDTVSAYLEDETKEETVIIEEPETEESTTQEWETETEEITETNQKDRIISIIVSVIVWIMLGLAGFLFIRKQYQERK